MENKIGGMNKVPSISEYIEETNKIYLEKYMIEILESNPNIESCGYIDENDECASLETLSLEYPIKILGDVCVYHLMVEVHKDIFGDNEDNIKKVVIGYDEGNAIVEDFNELSVIEMMDLIEQVYLRYYSIDIKGRKKNMNIIIKRDIDNVYEPGTKMSVKQLIDDYIDTSASEEDSLFFSNIGEERSANFIADAWGLEIEIL